LWGLLNCQGPGRRVSIVSIMGKRNLIKKFFKGSKKEAGFKWKAKINNTLHAGWAFVGPTQVPLPAPHIGRDLQRLGIFTPSYGTLTSLTDGELRST